MRTNLATLIAAASMLGVAAAQTPPPQSPPTQGERPSREQMFAAMDADHDGVVTRAEFDVFRPPNAPDRGALTDEQRQERRGRLFAAIDANGDGRITLEEMRAAPPMPDRPGGPPPR